MPIVLEAASGNIFVNATESVGVAESVGVYVIPTNTYLVVVSSAVGTSESALASEGISLASSETSGVTSSPSLYVVPLDTCAITVSSSLGVSESSSVSVEVKLATSEALGVTTSIALGIGIPLLLALGASENVGVAEGTLGAYIYPKDPAIWTSSTVGTAESVTANKPNVNYSIAVAETIGVAASGWAGSTITPPYYYLYATGSSPTLCLSCLNRSLEIRVRKIVKEQVRANGTLGRRVTAVKRTFGLSWKYLPGLTAEVGDGGLGAEALESLFITPGTLVFRIPDETTWYAEYTVLVVPDSFKRSLALRRAGSGQCYWDVSLSLQEV